MNAVLKEIWETRRDELQAADIEIQPAQNLVITKDWVIRLSPYTSRFFIERLLKPMIREGKEARRSAKNRKQTTLFEEKK